MYSSQSCLRGRVAVKKYLYQTHYSVYERTPKKVVKYVWQAGFSLWIYNQSVDDFGHVVATAPIKNFMVCGIVKSMVQSIQIN